MYFDKSRFASRGTFSFLYFDVVAGKNIRLRADDVPPWVKTVEDAEHFCRTKEAEGETAKLRAKRREEWKSRYHDFQDLLEKYTEDRKDKAPNSWGNDVYYLSQYPFHFFLIEKSCNSLSGWQFHFEDFRKWLKTVKPIKGSKPTLAFSTMNHCIKALNTFLVFAHATGEVSEPQKCKMFPKSMIRRKDLESVIRAEQEVRLSHELKAISPLMADRFLVEINTGLRDSEIAGLTIGDVVPGEPAQEHIKRMLLKNGISCLGYIILQDQVADGEHHRDGNGVVLRKPLKHKSTVCAQNNRIVPIEDRDTWNTLVKLFKERQEEFRAGKYGRDKRNYLLFEGITQQNFRIAMKRAAEKSHLRRFTPHDCRHTFATRLAGRTGGDYALCKMVLGHKDLATTEGYLHLFEYMNTQIENERALVEGLEFVEG